VEALLARLHHRGPSTPLNRETIVFPTELVWRTSVSTPAATARMVPAS